MDRGPAAAATSGKPSAPHARAMRAALRRLLERDPKLARYGEPLHFAVREGHSTRCRLLLDAGADPNLGHRTGEDLVVVARDRGHEEVARCLEDGPRVAAHARHRPTLDGGSCHPRGRGPRTTSRVRAGCSTPSQQLVHRGDRKGGTPLHRAVLASAHADDRTAARSRRRHPRAARLGPRRCRGLRGGRFPADRPRPVLASTVATSIRRGCCFARRRLRSVDCRGARRSAHIAAALWTRIPPHSRGAAVRESVRCRPPSSSATTRSSGCCWTAGADPNWPEGADAPHGFALHTAARLGNRAMVELLLDHGADPNAHVDSSGNATWAAKTPELRALLFARGGTLDCYDLVWLGEDDEVVRRVTADPGAANAGCGGVFTAAATLGKRDLVVRLLNAGARVPPVVTGCRSYLLEDPPNPPPAAGERHESRPAELAARDAAARSVRSRRPRPAAIRIASNARRSCSTPARRSRRRTRSTARRRSPGRRAIICPTWSNCCSPAARRPTCRTTSRGRRRSPGHSNADMAGSAICCGRRARLNKGTVPFSREDDPITTLRNREGRPASPFRTNTW